ncbi:MAG: M23 family metallopeptidase [Candidatus Promineifilaceae bacterium]
MVPGPKKGLDGITLAALAFMVFIGLSLVVDRGEGSSGQNDSPNPTPFQSAVSTGGKQATTPVSLPTTLPILEDPNLLAAPYDKYILTQGPHGSSYGHSAIDISAGKGAVIKSPINGVVSESYIDEYGNTTLLLDNGRYTVTFLHGDYIVNPGDTVTVGQQIGTESNHGYTMDMQGRLCTNRDCGYHSHLNVYDKSLGANIPNPLIYFEVQPSKTLTP